MSNTKLRINQSRENVWPEGLCQLTCKQLTKTLGLKRPALDGLIVVYCSSVNFATSVHIFA